MKHYGRWKRNGDPELTVNSPSGGSLEEKFRHFMPGEPPVDGSCWEWKAATSHNGYGYFALRPGEVVRAHRAAYQIFKGEEPGEVVRHTCDNPPCCNPDHLISGDHKENTQDMLERQRHKYGSSHYNSKLTEADVIEMRRLRDEGVTLSELAATYEVTPTNVHYIINRKTWRHLP